MRLTVDALKGLYSVLGGNSANVADETLIPEMIKRIAALISSGGATVLLPHVSSADNGKVLTVVNGKWTAVAPTAELPTVTSSNNGEVLTVVEGAWAAAELPTT